MTNQTKTNPDFQEAFDRLTESGGDPWKPTKAGERVAVRVSRIERRTVNTANGPASTIVVTGPDENDKVRDVWAWHTVLRNELVNAAPQPGDVIAIEYLGKIKAAGGGNGYHGYKVRRAGDSDGGAFDWGATPTADPVVDYAAQHVTVNTAPAAPEEDDIPF